MTGWELVCVVWLGVVCSGVGIAMFLVIEGWQRRRYDDKHLSPHSRALKELGR